MKKILMFGAILFGLLSPVFASDGDKFIQVGTGILYERGWDLTVGVEQETRYHNAWEYFGNVSEVERMPLLWSCLSRVFLEEL